MGPDESLGIAVVIATLEQEYLRRGRGQLGGMTPFQGERRLTWHDFVDHPHTARLSQGFAIGSQAGFAEAVIVLFVFEHDQLPRNRRTLLAREGLE